MEKNKYYLIWKINKMMMIIIILLIKFIDMLTIQMKQNINTLFKKNMKMLVLKSVRIWSHLLLVKLTCRVTLKILKTGTQIEMISKKKRNQILTELSVTGRKLNISTVFITKSYLADVSLNCTFFLVYIFLLWKLQGNKSFNKSLLSH